MSKTALKISTTAAFLSGFGIMPQSSTEFIPIRLSRSVIDSNPFIADQTASSEVQVPIIEMLRLGDDNYQRIQEITNLRYGWDGHKARPIPKSVINRTNDLVMMLPGGAKVFPTGRSTVQIEYHKSKDNYFEIEISTKTYEIYSLMGEEEFEDNVRKREVIKLVKEFLA